MISPRMLAMPPMRSSALGTDQDTTSGGRGGPAIAPVHPGGRIEHEEEKDEGRDQQGFGERAAAQLDHQRNKIQILLFRREHQFGDVVWPVDDVGVGEQEIVRRERCRACFNPSEMAQSLPDHPGGSGPAWITFSARFGCNRGRPIGTVIIHHESHAPGRSEAISACPTTASSLRAGMMTQTDLPSQRRWAWAER